MNNGATSVTLTSSLNPAVPGQPVTLKAVVTSPIGGTLTGTVTFLDSGTTLGVGSLNPSGQATFAVSPSLAVGTHAITTRYDGDANYATGTSAATSQVMAAAMFGVPAPQTVTAGQSVVIPLTLYQAEGSSLTFELTCSGLPAETPPRTRVRETYPSELPRIKTPKDQTVFTITGTSRGATANTSVAIEVQ